MTFLRRSGPMYLSDHYISQVMPDDAAKMQEAEQLLMQEGIRLDKNLDYTCAMYDGDGRIAATGSFFGNTLRCFAVHHDHQGEGLLNEVVSHLMQEELRRGKFHLFVYTKTSAAKLFKDLGFYEIASVDGTMVFLENRRSGFGDYIQSLIAETPDSAASDKEFRVGAIVMNADPFTLGHRYLVETAAARCSSLHVFVLSEDLSPVPFAVRMQLVKEGTADLPNVIVHESGPYMISAATFPSYFLKDETAVIEGHARLDIAVFTKIAQALSIEARWVGDEPFSPTTALYNSVMQKELPANGINCITIPRLTAKNEAISASAVRSLIESRDWDTLKDLVPSSTYSYFRQLYS